MAERTVSFVERGPAIPETVEAVHDCLDRLWAEARHIPEAERLPFTLAVVEAAGNVVDHAVPATRDGVELSVELTIEDDHLRAEIFEHNAEPASVDLDKTLPADDLADAGRGLAMMRTLVDTVAVDRREGSNVWVLVRATDRGDSGAAAR